MYETTANTRLERCFDPDFGPRDEDVRRRDFTVGGPTLAGHAFNAGLVRT